MHAVYGIEHCFAAALFTLHAWLDGIKNGHLQLFFPKNRHCGI